MQRVERPLCHVDQLWTHIKVQIQHCGSKASTSLGEMAILESIFLFLSSKIPILVFENTKKGRPLVFSTVYGAFASEIPGTFAVLNNFFHMQHNLSTEPDEQSFLKSWKVLSFFYFQLLYIMDNAWKKSIFLKPS